MNHIYIGGYTRRDSKGIYHMTLENGQLSPAELVAKVQNPTYLQVDPLNHKLYCNNSAAEGHNISSFQIEADGSLSKLADSASKNPNACYLALDKENEKIYSTVYSTAVFEVRSFDKVTGHIFNVEYSVKTQGGGPNKERQDGSHLHIAYPHDRYIFICDLGSDQILVLDRKSFQLLHSVAVEPGCGPRHIVIQGNKAYVITELNNHLIELDYDAETGNLQPVKYFPTLPHDFTGLSQGAAIRFGKHPHTLYVSNRGHNSITVFRLNTDGSVHGPIQNISTHGDWCRDFNITPDGEFLIAAHEKSDHVSLFHIAQDGSLKFLSNHITVPEGTGVAIL